MRRPAGRTSANKQLLHRTALDGGSQESRVVLARHVAHGCGAGLRLRSAHSRGEATSTAVSLSRSIRGRLADSSAPSSAARCGPANSAGQSHSTPQPTRPTRVAPKASRTCLLVIPTDRRRTVAAIADAKAIAVQTPVPSILQLPKGACSVPTWILPPRSTGLIKD